MTRSKHAQPSLLANSPKIQEAFPNFHLGFLRGCKQLCVHHPNPTSTPSHSGLHQSESRVQGEAAKADVAAAKQRLGDLNQRLAELRAQEREVSTEVFAILREAESTERQVPPDHFATLQRLPADVLLMLIVVRACVPPA